MGHSTIVVATVAPSQVQFAAGRPARPVSAETAAAKFEQERACFQHDAWVLVLLRRPTI